MVTFYPTYSRSKVDGLNNFAANYIVSIFCTIYVAINTSFISNSDFLPGFNLPD